MKIEVGKMYKATEDRVGIKMGEEVLVTNVYTDCVVFRKEGDPIQFRWGRKVFEDMFECDYQETDMKKPAHYDTAIDTISFAKANFSQEQVQGFMRINAVKYIQRYDKKNGLEDLKKARHYLDMLIEMEEQG